MSNRRDFMKKGFAVVAGLTVLPLVSAKAAEKVAANPQAHLAGIIYTTENQGKWAGKAKGHAPVVKVEGKQVTITTNHGMSEKHFIVRHTLVTASGEVIGEKTFSYNDEKAISVFTLPEGQHQFYATSFCNKHDLWMTGFSV